MLWVVALGHVVIDLNMNSLPPIMPRLVQELGLTLAAAGLIISVQQLLSAAAQAAFGYLVDRSSWRWFPVLGIGMTVFSMSLLSFSQSYGSLLIFAALVGAGSAVYHPAGSVLAARVCPGREGLAVSVFSLLGSIGFSAGALVAVPLVVASGLRGLLWLTPAGVGVMLAIATVVGRGASERAPRESTEAAGPVPLHCAPEDSPGSLPEIQGVRRAAPRPGGRAPAGTGFLLLLLTVSAGIRMWVGLALVSFMPVYLVGRGYSEVEAGQLIFGSLFGGAWAGLVAGAVSDRAGRRGTILVSVLLAALVLFWLFWVRSSLPSAALLILGGTLLGASNPVSIVMAQEMFPGGAGLATALVIGVASGLGSLGLPLTGWVADRTGVATAMQGTVLLLILSGVLVWLVPERRRGSGRGAGAFLAV
ncbi:MAG: MFS transporter [Firmicutes bacterium]|nr:MFS transporter [Bacillota bacterium]